MSCLVVGKLFDIYRENFDRLCFLHMYLLLWILSTVLQMSPGFKNNPVSVFFQRFVSFQIEKNYSFISHVLVFQLSD